MPPVRDWIDPKGVPVRIYAKCGKGLVKNALFALQVAAMLIRERESYDFVYFLMQGMHLAFGLPVARLLRKPVVMKVTGSGEVLRMAKSTLGRLELHWLRKWAHRVMILNEGMRAEAINSGLPPESLHWMPNPVDTDEFAPATPADQNALRSRFGIPTNAKVILYCGRLAPEKALPSLLDAFAIVVHEDPEALLLIIGDGPLRTELEAQVRRLGLSEKSVRFTGQVEPDDVSSWLRIADVFALVSVFEGFPCSLTEAMSTSIPSVVSDIPANRQLVEDGEQGFLVPVGDSRAIAVAALRLLRDLQLRQRMGQLARRSIVDNYSTAEVTDRYDAIFRSLP
jgi:glycosyltransferase involved in cell wall biosynthesis